MSMSNLGRGAVRRERTHGQDVPTFYRSTTLLMLLMLLLSIQRSSIETTVHTHLLIVMCCCLTFSKANTGNFIAETSAFFITV